MINLEPTNFSPNGGDRRDTQIDDIVIDVLQRRELGEEISDENVISEHPDLMPELGEELLLAVELQQDTADDGNYETATQIHRSPSSRALKIRCPHCQHPTEILSDTPFTDVTCGSCGSHFSLVEDTTQPQAAKVLKRLGHFELVERIGLGSFGTVWKARDIKLDRTVAVKIPRQGSLEPDEVEQFLREARAAAQLNHRNIVSVHEVGRANDTIYIVSDLVHGVPLSNWLTDQEPTWQKTAELCATIADALHHAHEAGVIHRDVKPQNIMLDADGHPHLMDFGLARRDASEVTLTMDGRVLGTPAYMSPEQARGEAHQADCRTDIYSLGVILFELLTGQLPFRGNVRMLIHQVLNEAPPSPREFSGSVPKDLETICLKCLYKEPQDRYPSAEALALDLRRFIRGDAIEARPQSTLEKIVRRISSHKVPVSLGVVILVALVAIAFSAHRYQRARWARVDALPEAKRLHDERRYLEAFNLTREASRHVPDDPALIQMWNLVSRSYSVVSDPPGAEVFFRDYVDTGGRWIRLGVTPLVDLEFPLGMYRWRFEMSGFDALEICGGATIAEEGLEVVLQPSERVPHGMVFVPGGAFDEMPKSLRAVDSIDTPGYWMDRFEVTNGDFQAFAEGGGYGEERYWKHEFKRDGQTVSFQDAVAGLVDSSGQPGPSTWEGGTYPAGMENHPVTGVCWYEAAAYAEFVGKRLPSVLHWSHAAGFPAARWIGGESNLQGQGLAPVGSFPAISPYGIRDMGGNAQEWCVNTNTKFPGQRFVLGGTWNDVRYAFNGYLSLSPWDRSNTNGFRCVKFPEGKDVPAELFSDLTPRSPRDISDFEPMSDEEFRFIKDSLYDYDPTPLNALVEVVQDTMEPRHETITFDAAYPDTRVTAHLFLPRLEDVAPPYQAVVYFPGTDQGTFDEQNQALYTDLIVESGRALLFPIYDGTYDRRYEHSNVGLIEYRDRTIRKSKDMQRAIDYLVTRDDIDDQRIAYYGASYGAWLGPMMMAVEDRFRCGVLVAGGLRKRIMAPAIDQCNVAPRVNIPVRMINGGYDTIFPLEESQKPLFDLLGTPDKKHIVYDGPHSIGQMFARELRQDTLSWFDRWLGPVDATWGAEQAPE